ncbi:MAG: hypothetical protein HC896_11555 [Bacteroidales bacterium]|nr:hypothetical protein [Bacteroidales bacterium]
MVTYSRVPISGDPSSRIQLFEHLAPNVLCCRYWWLDNWKSDKMAFPYWRLYWNKVGGAYVHYKQDVQLTPEKLVLIPPNTMFSTGIAGAQYNNSSAGYSLIGNMVSSLAEEQHCIENHRVLHLFIHFNLGGPFDNVKPGIYSFDINNEQKQTINKVTTKLIKENSRFNAMDSLGIYSLILSAVCNMPANVLVAKNLERRLSLLLSFIDDNINQQLTNVLWPQE